eukprot:snap_masked-scaffold_13-processed-gene-4.42-mRNA-1 protein AED:0.04 eAED:0.04 QI:0/-1/0/1/-1/1/1/0/520
MDLLSDDEEVSQPPVNISQPTRQVNHVPNLPYRPQANKILQHSPVHQVPKPFIPPNTSHSSVSTTSVASKIDNKPLFQRTSPTQIQPTYPPNLQSIPENQKNVSVTTLKELLRHTKRLETNNTTINLNSLNALTRQLATPTFVALLHSNNQRKLQFVSEIVQVLGVDKYKKYFLELNNNSKKIFKLSVNGLKQHGTKEQAEYATKLLTEYCQKTIHRTATDAVSFLLKTIQKMDSKLFSNVLNSIKNNPQQTQKTQRIVSTRPESKPFSAIQREARSASPIVQVPPSSPVKAIIDPNEAVTLPDGNEPHEVFSQEIMERLVRKRIKNMNKEETEFDENYEDIQVEQVKEISKYLKEEITDIVDRTFKDVLSKRKFEDLPCKGSWREALEYENRLYKAQRDLNIARRGIIFLNEAKYEQEHDLFPKKHLLPDAFSRNRLKIKKDLLARHRKDPQNAEREAINRTREIANEFKKDMIQMSNKLPETIKRRKILRDHEFFKAVSHLEDKNLVNIWRIASKNIY